jgi:uncharacterized protein (DUF488 family)
MQLFTIGFTQKSAREFFNLLEDNGVRKIVDIRINNTSQLSGFAKGSDLEYFSRVILDIPYEHVLDFAPTQDLLKRYRDKETTWDEYEKEYLSLLRDRKILENLDLESLDGACLLCSEHLPDHCHRRLLAEYIQSHHPGLEIIHLEA